MRDLTKQDFDKLWAGASATLVAGMLATQHDVWAAYGINKAIRLAHFMAQISHESGIGKEMEESLNYSATALLRQWPTHFNAHQANDYGRTADHGANQRMIGNLAYGGRMGNAPYPSNDGYNFRGRGLLQITGKDSYKHIGLLCGLDLINHPELVIDPHHALAVAATEFKASGCLPYCDTDNLLAVSSLINVGHIVNTPSSVIGYDKRVVWLAKWKAQLGI